jgi:hypothetical protein
MNSKGRIGRNLQSLASIQRDSVYVVHRFTGD